MNDILLVDDEEASLQSLIAALDWSEYGFNHIHTACNAKEALRIMKDNLIVLIILDIQMPGMTGLEMLKEVRTKYPNTRCILISAYSKFEYAKEALQLNVENYLLKPLDINELRETIAHAAENIAKASITSHNLFERNLLERWLYGRITSDELIEHSQYTDYNVLMRHYYAIIVHKKGNAALPLHSLAAAFPRDIAVYPLNVDAHTGILLCGGHDISDTLVEGSASPIAAVYPGIRVICGSCATGSGNVSKSLADAKHALEYARLSGHTGYLSFEQIDRNPFSPEQLAMLNDMLQPELSEKQIHEFITQLSDGKPATDCDYCSLYAHICLTLTNQLEEPDLKNISFPPLDAPCTPELFEKAIKKAILLLSSSRQQCAQNLSPITQCILRYIRDNLSSSISIKHFCEQKNMNSTYIGRLFKEELGMYFSEYVCALRINKAKVLLENTTISVSDIARQVGIYDVSYFVQCFKKQERTSPMKYRQAVLQKNL